MDPLSAASRAKGLPVLLKRFRSVASRYDLTTGKMDQALRLFTDVLGQLGQGASFALTALVLKRNQSVIQSYLNHNVEFLVHGYTHIDYSQLAFEKQLTHFRQAREIFAAAGIDVVGFRSPYLCCGGHLYTAIEAAGFTYTSNQPVMWDVLNPAIFTPTARIGYEHAFEFYDPWLAKDRVSLPQFVGNLIEIPVSLPDDEILVDRLDGESNHLVKETWLSILAEVYRRDELFTVQLHPERIAVCLEGLSAVLTEAMARSPVMWIARLDQLAAWWRAMAAAVVDVESIRDGAWRVTVTGPKGICLLVRNVETIESTEPWFSGYQLVSGSSCTIQAARCPWVGVSPATPSALVDFLRQQGYIVETGDDGHHYGVYLDWTDYTVQDERALLAEIEGSISPLVRLGRWPNGARGAVCISGDIDALTLWDYGLRLLGK